MAAMLAAAARRSTCVMSERSVLAAALRTPFIANRAAPSARAFSGIPSGTAAPGTPHQQQGVASGGGNGSNTDNSRTESERLRAELHAAYIRNPNPQRKALIDEMLRVDQAGEIGAVQIYRGQHWVLRDSPIGGTLKSMQAGEEVHLQTLSRMMAERRVRPTVLAPLWEVAGFALGAATAMMGKEAAMACTVAVETAISKHYNDQIRELLEKGYDEDGSLKAVFKQHRDEELEHHDTALQHGAEQAPMYSLLSNAIQAGCSVAIAVAKKI